MIPVIISGGSGTRLWPVSRKACPKQFSKILDESLFVKTYKRLQPLGNPWVITTEALKVLTEKSLKEIGQSAERVIYEPFAMNTAPAIALLCKNFEMSGQSEEVVGVFPADHYIPDASLFHQHVRAAEEIAKSGQIVTLGIKPTLPSTGYGYIELQGKGVGGIEGLCAIGFREKPALEKAIEFLEKGNFVWNAGMFIFKVSTLIAEFKKHMPELWQAIEDLEVDHSNLKEIYSKCPSQSIDYGIMEKLESHTCVPCSFSWSDIGSWDALVNLNGDFEGEKIQVEATNNALAGMKDKTYAFIGVDDLVVIDTEDALVVAKKGETEKVKNVVDQLSKAGSQKVKDHNFEIRPWGQYRILNDTEYYKSKVITVDPKAQLSYQSHNNRSEHWVVVKGRGEVVLNDEVIPVSYGKHVFIPVGAKHRIRNTSETPLEFIEVQSGSYFGEDDIVRYQDDYART
ncbi:MAG: mannose-1-phosphate guanylyltransferase/mannose-6-phosphate isomerase [Bdellovibrionales bacterium]|nr:mannose-1-phosphate guanylyltransferase/mannose-6-phosphate isomerase [Bdellovibrionales bacterium]